MDLTALQTELTARGFDRLDASGSTRKNAYINRAYNYICESEDWPFLLTTVTGTPPLAVSDLRTVESVVNTTDKGRLFPLDPRHILDGDYQLSTTGTPSLYYVTSAGISVYPANTGKTLSVRYYKVPAALASGADIPVIPTRFHLLIVDYAVYLAFTDRNNFEVAEGVKVVFDQGMAQMRDSLLSQQHDSVDDWVVVRAGSEDW